MRMRMQIAATAANHGMKVVLQAELVLVRQLWLTRPLDLLVQLGQDPVVLIQFGHQVIEGKIAATASRDSGRSQEMMLQLLWWWWWCMLVRVRVRDGLVTESLLLLVQVGQLGTEFSFKFSQSTSPLLALLLLLLLFVVVLLIVLVLVLLVFRAVRVLVVRLAIVVAVIVVVVLFVTQAAAGQRSATPPAPPPSPPQWPSSPSSCRPPRRRSPASSETTDLLFFIIVIVVVVPDHRLRLREVSHLLCLLLRQQSVLVYRWRMPAAVAAVACGVFSGLIAGREQHALVHARSCCCFERPLLTRFAGRSRRRRRP